MIRTTGNQLRLSKNAPPPSEVRLCKFGENKEPVFGNPFTFDRATAERVLLASHRHGADVMIDYDHRSLSPEHPGFNPDALGWCKLALKADGLYATSIRWNSAGLKTLCAGTHPVLSTAFQTDEEDNVVGVINVALTKYKMHYTVLSSVSHRYGPKPKPKPTPPKLSRHELAVCRARGINPEQLVAAKAGIVRRANV